jgi:hypothetical protein
MSKLSFAKSLPINTTKQLNMGFPTTRSLTSLPLPASQMSNTRRWREHRIPVGEYAIIQQKYMDTGKTVYHLLVNAYHCDALLAVGDELLATFDHAKTGRKLSPVTVHPGDYGLETAQNMQWYLFRYVTKGEGDILPSKIWAAAVRCVYWETTKEFTAKNGVSLTALRSIPQDQVASSSGELAENNEHIEQVLI